MADDEDTEAGEAEGSGRPGPTMRVTIQPPNFQHIIFALQSAAPYVQHKFSSRAKLAIEATQKEGAKSRAKKEREPRDFGRDYREAIHVAEDGWYGIPCSSFRSAMISACRTVGFVMTRAKLAIFVEPDGYDREDNSPLVRILEGEPEPYMAHVRNEGGTVDLRCRPMWRQWRADVQVRYDADMLAPADVANLMQRAGLQVGLGEGRPDSRRSHGCGWGLFTSLRETGG